MLIGRQRRAMTSIILHQLRGGGGARTFKMGGQNGGSSTRRGGSASRRKKRVVKTGAEVMFGIIEHIENRSVKETKLPRWKPTE